MIGQFKKVLLKVLTDNIVSKLMLSDVVKQ